MRLKQKNENKSSIDIRVIVSPSYTLFFYEVVISILQRQQKVLSSKTKVTITIYYIYIIMFHGSSNAFSMKIRGLFFGGLRLIIFLAFRLHSFASVSKTKHSMVTKVTVIPSSSRKKSYSLLFTDDESVFGSQVTEPPRLVKEVNCKERDPSSDQISNSNESQIEEEDLQLSISIKYNSISFQQSCPSQVPSYGCRTSTRTENDFFF